jgi:FHS family L-fucose permease-like MFS transporter
MAIIGGAVLTPAMGWVSERFRHVAPAYAVPLVAYVFIAFYAFLGAKQKGSEATLQSA